MLFPLVPSCFIVAHAVAIRCEARHILLQLLPEEEHVFPTVIFVRGREQGVFLAEVLHDPVEHLILECALSRVEGDLFDPGRLGISLPHLVDVHILRREGALDELVESLLVVLDQGLVLGLLGLRGLRGEGLGPLELR